MMQILGLRSATKEKKTVEKEQQQEEEEEEEEEEGEEEEEEMEVDVHSDVVQSNATTTTTATTTTAAAAAISPAPKSYVLGPARPLRLVYCDEKGKFKMDPEAVAALQVVKGPLGVVSVCGRARQGKSFILNQLLGKSSGFQVAATHRPCTKGLWMWSTPIKRTAADGSEYSLVLLDSEGIDSYDQTGTYSIQIFSLAVLLSSMFVYNQMNGIDEAALDNLSLVTEMTKHIRVRASQNTASTNELGQFAPLFVWLLRDFYLELSEDGQQITPRDYLESALQPLPGTGKAIAAKNEIRNSIRALFPERDCFTLVRPLEAEKQLQHLDEIPMEELRPEFRSGMDALAKYILQRARPKQLGSIVLTGPMFAALTQSFLDAINAGAVPTIATSWQNVEENECRRAHDLAIETYINSFDKSTPPEEVLLQEAHEEALQVALNVFNTEAVGGGNARKKYEQQLYSTVKKKFEEHKRNISMEAELKCLRAVGSMEERMRNACNAPNASFDSVVKVVDGLVAEYEMAATGSFKWQKLVKFLQKSLAGPLHDLVKRAGDKAAAEYASLELQLRSMEEKVAFATNQVDAARRDSLQWKKQYEVSMSDYQKFSENSATQYANIQKKVTTLEERHSTSVTKYESAKKEATEWQTKYEKLVAQHQSDEERFKSDFGALQNRCSTAEARLAAMKEQSESAKEEAAEWKRKHEAVAVETKEVIERTISQKDKAIKQAQAHEDTLRAEYTATVSRKEEEAKDLQARIEQGERTIASLTAHMKEQELRTNSQLEELMMLRDELKKLQSDYEATKSSTLIFQKDLEKAQQERAYAEERMAEAVKRMEEAEKKRKRVQEDAKRAAETVEKSRNELAVVERTKLETQQLAAERLAIIERSERHCQTVERERAALTEALEQAKVGQEEALAQARALELRFEEREREMENLLIKSHEQRAKTVEGFENLLMSERAAKVDASNRAEALSIQLQTVQADLDALQTQLMSVRNHETALDTKLKSYADNNTVTTISPSGNTAARSNKRGLSDDLVVTSSAAAAAYGSMEIDMTTSTKRAKNGQSEVHGIQEEEEEEEGEGHNSNEIVIRDAPFAAADYRKLTIAKLKQKLTEAGFGDEVVHLRTPTKKDLIALYEKVMVNV